MTTYDHIVIGGGSAGCAVASGLVKNGAKVLILEGGHSHEHYLLDMPPGFFKLIEKSKYVLYHKTIAQKLLNNRRQEIPQGNVLGGGSSINGQVYMRGRPFDFDGWNEMITSKNAGKNNEVNWGWNAVLPYLRDMEGNNRLFNDLHNSDGPLKVSDPGHINILSRLFVQTLQGMGEPFSSDFNGHKQRGVGYYQFTNRDGQRCSAAHAFLGDLKGNSNLTIKLQSPVQKIIIENGKAVGVRIKNKNGAVEDIRCNKDVILSAGALVTPKILMLSGIGDAKELKSHDIECVADLPGVGKNLIDHPEVPLTAYCNGPYGYFKQGDGWRMIKNGIQFKLFGTGLITTTGFEAGAFTNPIKPDETPCIQAFCVPVVYGDKDQNIKDDYGMTITVVVVKPKSRGTITLASANPDDKPVISTNMFEHPDDLKKMKAAVRYYVDVFKEKPLCDYIDRIVLPNPDDLSDKAIEEHCRNAVKTNYHPVGTAKMGGDEDPMAVLTPNLKVRGVEGLRVCDVSAAPDIVSGNTNATAMMLGMRCADFIAEDNQ